MKRVMLIGISMYPTAIGGTEYLIYHIAQRFQKIYNLALLLNEENTKQKELSHFKIFPIVIPTTRGKSRITFYKTFFEGLIKYKPDSIYCFLVEEYAFLALIYAKIFRKKITVHSQGSELNFLGNLQKRLMKIFVCKYANQIVCISPYHKKIVDGFHPKTPPVVIGSGSEFLQEPTPFGKNLSKEKYTLLFVGRLNPIKNIPVLLNAFSQVLAKKDEIDRPIELVIIGDGPSKEELLKLSHSLYIDKSTFFKGFVSREELVDTYRKADIFILPSISEASPLVLAEAMSFGCPLILSKIPNFFMFYKEKTHCLYFRKTNTEDLTNQILYMLKNEKLRNQIRQNNWEESKHNTWDEVVKKIEKFV